MLHILALLLVSSFANLVRGEASCPNGLCKGGRPSATASFLSGYAPASKFCSSSYPVPRQTCTSTAPRTTITSTVATRTVTTITTVGHLDTAPPSVITETETTTPAFTFTITDTATSTSTITVTTTTTVLPNQKRAVDPQSSRLSQLKAQPVSFIGSVCRCLETPASTTVTRTPTSTTRVTARSTTIVTVTNTGIFFPTITSTSTEQASPTETITHVTTTTTTTTTATSTSTVIGSNNHACTPGDPGTEFPEQCGPQGAKCACYRENSNDGHGYCAGYYGPCGTQCSSNSDCPTGSACLAASESSCGFPICASQSDINSCPTGVIQKRFTKNPMAFKNIVRGTTTQMRRTGPYVPPEYDDE